MVWRTDDCRPTQCVSHSPKREYSSDSTCVIDELVPPARDIESSLRIPVSNVFRGGTGGLSSGLGVSGRILTGIIQVGERVRVLPGDETATVRSMCHILNACRKVKFNSRLIEIECEENSVPWASAGSNTTLYLTGIERINIGYAILPHARCFLMVIVSQRWECSLPPFQSRPSCL